VRPSGRAVGRSEVRSLSVGVFRRDATVVGRARGQVLVKAPRVSFDLIEVGLFRLAQVFAVGSVLRGRSWAQGGDRATGLRETESGTWERESPREHRPARVNSRRVRIFAGSKALKSRGIVTFWSSEQENAMSETAGGHRRREAYGSAEGKGSGG